MIQETNTSEGSKVDFERPRMAAVALEAVSTVNGGTVHAEVEIPMAASKDGIASTSESVANIATKIFRARIDEALKLLSNANTEWNSGSTTWLTSIHRARDVLNDLIRFDEY